MNRRNIAICVFVLSLSACSFHIRQFVPEDYIPPIETSSHRSLCGDGIVAGKESMRLDWSLSRESENYRAMPFWFQARDTGNKKNDVIKGEVFFQKHPFGHDKIIFLFPGTGENISTQGSAELLADNAFDVVRFRSGIDIFDKREIIAKELISPSELRLLARKGSNNIKVRMCDYISIINYFDKHYDYDSVGVSGVSLGGIFVSLITYEHKKVDASLMMISGANIVEILRTSKERSIVDIRNILLERFDGSTVQFWQILSEELADIDPANETRSFNRNNMLVIANYWDTVIKYRYAQKLRDAWHNPLFEVIVFPPGHYGSVFLLWIPMVRWEGVVMGPVPFFWPASVDTVKNINLRFFIKTLPIR